MFRLLFIRTKDHRLNKEIHSQTIIQLAPNVTAGTTHCSRRSGLTFIHHSREHCIWYIVHCRCDLHQFNRAALFDFVIKVLMATSPPWKPSRWLSLRMAIHRSDIPGPLLKHLGYVCLWLGATLQITRNCYPWHLSHSIVDLPHIQSITGHILGTFKQSLLFYFSIT